MQNLTHWAYGLFQKIVAPLPPPPQKKKERKNKHIFLEKSFMKNKQDKLSVDKCFVQFTEINVYKDIR